MNRKDLIKLLEFFKKFQGMSFKEQNLVLKKFEKYIAKNGVD